MWLLYTAQNEHQGQSSPYLIYIAQTRDRKRVGERERETSWIFSKSNVRWSIRVGSIACKSIYVCNTIKRLSTSTRWLWKLKWYIKYIYFGIVVYDSRKKLLSTANSSSLREKSEWEKLCSLHMDNHRLAVWPFAWRKRFIWNSIPLLVCQTKTTATTQFRSI